MYIQAKTLLWSIGMAEERISLFSLPCVPNYNLKRSEELVYDIPAIIPQPSLPSILLFYLWLLAFSVCNGLEVCV
jgi:hypothetical protein